MKYLLKEVPFGSSAVQTMCSVLLFVLPIYLALYHFISRHAERKNKEKNHIAEERIYDWIMHPPSNTKYIINVGSDSLSFLDKYNYITAGFIKNLNALGINDSCKEYSTLIFCLFITSMIQGTKGWSFEDDVFDMAEKLLNLPEETARKDIENIIKRTWLLEDYKTLKKEYYSTCFLHDYSRESSAPTVSEFLINMAKKNKMSLEELILDKRTSQPIARHAGLVSVHGEGILITGASGIGKSEAALELVDKGHRLVADDMVEIRRMNNSLYGNACQESRNFAESRGLGIVNVRRLVGRSGVMDCERIDLVINLVPGDDNNYDRLGEEQNWADILGVRVPYINVAVRPGRSLSNIIKIAAMNNRQKFLGFVAVNELYSNLGAENIPVKPKIINENAIWGVNTQV